MMLHEVVSFLHPEVAFRFRCHRCGRLHGEFADLEDRICHCFFTRVMAAKVLAGIRKEGFSVSQAVRWMDWGTVAAMELEAAKEEIARRGRR